MVEYRPSGNTSPEGKTVRILGTHGVPAAYGGFETAAQNIGLFLAEAGWRVIVYCQTDGRGPIREDSWRGLERVLIPIDVDGWRGTAKFDLISIRHAARHRDVCLTFGYNTAIFNALQRARRIPLVINMDGIEWSRAKWGPALKTVLYLNERIACLLGNHLIADHPEIARYLNRKAPASKLSTVAYGAPAVTNAPPSVPAKFGLEPGRYLTLIARPVPENSVLELVQAFSARRRGVRLAVLGNYHAQANGYHRAVMAAASDEVDFLGAIFEPDVRALRFHCLAYLHGHTVGGTNPSLVEALGAGNPVVAHNNIYNRWTAGDHAAVYFSNRHDAVATLDELLARPEKLAAMSAAARRRHAEEFTWEYIAGQYERILERFVAARPSADARIK